jgi:hypothetical protein
MTSFGPCITHCGSRVSVGVKVDVGGGVSDAGVVGVIVGNRIGVMVAAWVGEGRGEVVDVGTTVGVGGTISPNPPQAIRKKAVLEMMSKNLLMIISQQRSPVLAPGASVDWAP